MGRTDKSPCLHGGSILLQSHRQGTNKSGGMTDGVKYYSHVGRRGNVMPEKGKFAILNKVTFEQSPGEEEGDPADRCLGEEQLKQRDQQVQKPYLLNFLLPDSSFFYILVLFKMTLLSCTL